MQINPSSAKTKMQLEGFSLDFIIILVLTMLQYFLHQFSDPPFPLEGFLRYERNETIIFIFSLSWPFPNYFGLKWCHNGIVEFFCYLFEIFYFALGWNETERQYLFSFFLGLFHPILALNEATMVFSNFLIFFCNFFGIFNYESSRDGTKQ